MLDTDLPVWAAPMAGGPTTPALVVTAAHAGSLGFLAGGYRTAADLEAQIAAVREGTDRFGVNLFAPHPIRVDPVAYAAYRERLLPLAEQYGVELPELPVEDDDGWGDKVDVLLADPPPVVSFTFGLPDAAAASALHRAGVLLVQTVTSVDEARQAVDLGVDVVLAQASAAGGHSGVFLPGAPAADRSLPDLVAELVGRVGVPVLGAGGIATAADVARALDVGAAGVLVGTALLLAPEAGTSTAVRDALTDPTRSGTAMTQAFTGRPARGLGNAFMTAFDASAPLGYPALHHLTSPIRRAAAAAGDPEWVNLWAGTGFRSVAPVPAAETLRSLAGRS